LHLNMFGVIFMKTDMINYFHNQQSKSLHRQKKGDSTNLVNLGLRQSG